MTDSIRLGDAVHIILFKTNDGGATWVPVENPSAGGGGGGSSVWGDITGTLTDQTDLVTYVAAAIATAEAYADSLAPDYDPAGAAAAVTPASLGLVIGTNVEAHDADLTAIAALTPSNDDVIQRKAGAWTNRTMAQVKTDLALAKSDVGLGNVDNTSDATKNTATATLTNKRITRRVLALSANSATPAINTDNYDVVHITAQTAAINTFTTNLSGTPGDGDELRISVTGTGAVAFTWGASFESGAATLPTTTTGTTRLDMLFYWNTETTKWRCMAAG